TGFIDVYGQGRAPLPQVALLRGGTMNTVANSIGVPRGKPDGLLERLVHAYARRAVEPLHQAQRYMMRAAPMHADGDLGKPQFGFLFGTGVVHGFLSEYYGTGEPS